MEFEHLTTEELKQLSPEEKKEFVRKLIHSEAAGVHAAFFNPVTKETVGMKDLVEHLGEEEALEIILRAMESAESRTATLNTTDIKNLMLKAQRGECSEDELAMLEFVQNQIINEQDDLQFERHWMDDTLQLIHYAQKYIQYNPGLKDILTASIILFSLSGIAKENGALSKYTPADSGIITEICGDIADDIYETWKDSCTSLPEPELIVIGLLQLAARIAHENNIEFSNAETIAEWIGVELLECEEENDDTENGSNENTESNICQPTVYNPSQKDKDMRNLLKE